MRRTARLLAVTGLVALVAPVAAHAAVTPTLRTENVFFHCNGSTKLANASVVEKGAVPTWNTTAPTAAVTSGAGCGWADPGAIKHTTYSGNAGDAAFAGTFTGNLSALTLKVHNIYAGTGRTTNKNITTRVSVRIDGIEMFTPDAGSTTPARVSVAVDPTMSSSGASGEFAVSVTDLPFATEDGNGIKVHTVEVVIGTSQDVNAWVYDTTDVPSGIVFNPATLAAARASAVPQG